MERVTSITLQQSAEENKKMTGTTTNTRRKLIKSQVARAAAAGLVSVLALSLAACSTESTASPESSGAASASAAPTETKPAYAQLTLDQNNPAYTPNPEFLPRVAPFGWTPEDVAAGQRFAVDYSVQEFLDSSALETGDEGYRAWHANEAKKYLSDELHAKVADGSGTLVIGNIAGRFMIPELIKDGAPRMRDLTMTVSDTGSAALNRITYIIDYSGNYRVSDASAAKFMSDLSIKKLPVEKHLTPEQFLASDMATPKVKDGVGENNMSISGTLTVYMEKNDEGVLVIDGFKTNSSINTDDFSMNDEAYFTK